ncbi:MAG: hypothetical protein LBV54_06555, partial [Puniceicoccales bacterium]|nr:hypothetical protein [Puniceicoccales bacterium]
AIGAVADGVTGQLTAPDARKPNARNRTWNVYAATRRPSKRAKVTLQGRFVCWQCDRQNAGDHFNAPYDKSRNEFGVREDLQ